MSDVIAVENPPETAPETEVVAELVTPPTVGQLLQAARIAAQQSVEDIAQALKFSPRQVEALEQDDYAALPGNTIVRGFVRSYARHLKLDAAPLLLHLDTLLPAAPADVRPPDNMGVAAVNGEGQQIGPRLAMVIVVALAALLLAGWHFFGPRPSAVVSTVQSTAQQHEAAQPVAPVIGLANSAPPATTPTAVVPTPRLQLQFDDRAWAEVRDADGLVLYSGENPAGAQLSLDGKAPFDLVIGNSAKVKLSFDGRTIDLAAHTRAEVARLKLE